MSAFESKERRATVRAATPAAAELTHPVSGKPVAARCRDVSRGGAGLILPARFPVRIGQTVSLAVIDAPDADDLGCFDSDTRPATVVRIDRESFLASGHVAVGVAFVD